MVRIPSDLVVRRFKAAPITSRSQDLQAVGFELGFPLRLQNQLDQRLVCPVVQGWQA